MKGILGVNATDYGVSRDNLRGVYRKIGGAQLLSRNSPELAAMALQDGAPFVVYRETDDDPQHSPLNQNPRDFVMKRASKVAPGAYIHLTNELDPSAALNAWTLAALTVCEELGRKAVVFNYSTHKSKAQYAMSEAVIRRAVAGKHAVGVHVYESSIDEFDEGAYQWLDLYRQVGGLWLITEFAWIESIFVAERGFRVGLSDEAHERFLKKRAARFATLRTPTAHFSYEHWPNTLEGITSGFGFMDRPVVIDALAVQNRVYVYQPQPTPPTMLLDGVLTATLSNVVNVRADKTTSAAILRTLKVGDALRYSPNTVTGGTYSANGKPLNSWYALDKGYIAAGVVTIGAPGESPDVPIKRLDVPFVSQLGADANARNNDCGVAACLMLIQHTLQRAGMRPMPALKVNRLIADTPLATTDAPLGLSALVSLLDAYGVTAQTARPLNADAITRQLDAGKPPILLVNYQPIGGEAIGHYVVAIGYSARGFWIHDPYKRGAAHYITRQALDAALATVTDIGAASWPYQGVTLN